MYEGIRQWEVGKEGEIFNLKVPEEIVRSNGYVLFVDCGDDLTGVYMYHHLSNWTLLIYAILCMLIILQENEKERKNGTEQWNDELGTWVLGKSFTAIVQKCSHYIK